MSGNHARRDDYQPGQLLPPPDPTYPNATDTNAVVANAWNDSSFWGAWGTITYTPPRDTWAEIKAHAVISHNLNDVLGGIKIVETAVALGDIAIGGWVALRAAHPIGFIVSTSRFMELTGGTTYTFKVQLIWNNNGNGTVWSPVQYSRLEIIPIRHP